MDKKGKNIKDLVREGYAKIAKNEMSCGSSSPCCSGTSQAKDISKAVGYSDSEIDAVPDGANLGLGCGNPVALASLKEGDVVLDLGSGAGFDAFLCAKRVGKTGQVLGVDMTPEMILRAKENAIRGGYSNLEFRLGEIEKLPVDDNSVDVVISNCVINLSPEKEKVFKEAYRVLKAGGRLMVSDLVLVKDLPKDIKDSVEAYVVCIAGAIKKDAYLKLILMAGFKDVKVIGESCYPVDAMFDNLECAKDAIVSVKVSAIKR